MTQCNPRTPLLSCHTCARHAPHMPHLAECRPHTLVIDATVVAKGEDCPMYEHKAVAVRWWNVEQEAA